MVTIRPAFVTVSGERKRRPSTSPPLASAAYIVASDSAVNMPFTAGMTVSRIGGSGPMKSLAKPRVIRASMPRLGSSGPRIMPMARGL